MTGDYHGVYKIIELAFHPDDLEGPPEPDPLVHATTLKVLKVLGRDAEAQVTDTEVLPREEGAS